MHKSTITITFGDQAENHVGMQKIGKMAKSGFTYEELAAVKEIFEKKDYKCELINLSPDDSYPAASILIVRNGVNCLLSDVSKTADDLHKEQCKLKPDSKALMYGRVVNKIARHNLCFDDKSQEADYAKGKGTIIKFDDVPLTKVIRDVLPIYFGEKAKNLLAEGNYYNHKGGIGFHGDAERKIVIAIRTGKTMNLVFRWYHKNTAVGRDIKLMLNSGDLYSMSEKATGNDWKFSSIKTLRHAAGSEKYVA